MYSTYGIWEIEVIIPEVNDSRCFETKCKDSQAQDVTSDEYSKLNLVFPSESKPIRKSYCPKNMKNHEVRSQYDDFI